VIRRLLVLCLLFLLFVAPVAAQQRPGMLVEVESGSRVRVTTVSGRVVGELMQGDDPGTLLLRRRGGDLRLPLGEILSLEGRGGRDRMRGAWRGGAILATITTSGALVDLARGAEGVGVGEVISASAGGALLGAAIGAAVAPVGWVPVPWSGRLQVVPAR
jgi:hypothetical protein